MKDTDGRDIASATKFVSPFTYLMSVVSSAIKSNCLVCRSGGRSVTDVITKVKGLWFVLTKKLQPSKLCLKCLLVAYAAKSSRSNALKRVSAGVLKNESGRQTLSMYCCKTPPTAKSLASHVIFNVLRLQCIYTTRFWVRLLLHGL